MNEAGGGEPDGKDGESDLCEADGEMAAENTEVLEDVRKGDETQRSEETHT